MYNAQTSTLDLKLIILFLFSIVLVSSITVASMTTSAMVAMLMVVLFILNGFIKGKFILIQHPVQKPLLLLLLWALVSLLLSELLTSKALPSAEELNIYKWITGLNSPQVRGIAFLFRLFLSIFAIQYIVMYVNSEIKYIKVVNYYLLAYSMVCVYVIIQISLFIFFGIEVGAIYDNFRFGGFIGEPSTLAGLLVSGYFLILSLLIKTNKSIWYSISFLKCIIIIATIDLLFTFSAAWIPSAIIAFVLTGRKYLGGKKLIYLLTAVLLLSIIFHEAFYLSVIKKSMDPLINVINAIDVGSAYSTEGYFMFNSRIATMISGIKIFLNNPISGIGIGKSPFFMPLQMINDFGYEARFYSEAYYSSRIPPLNTYIQWMAETGIIGLAILIYIIYSLYKQSKRINNASYKHLINFGFGGALIAVAIAINAIPDYLYVGYINFLIAMYITGIKLFGGKSLNNNRT